jgi:hypothetical protein
MTESAVSVCCDRGGFRYVDQTFYWWMLAVGLKEVMWAVDCREKEETFLELLALDVGWETSRSEEKA